MPPQKLRRGRMMGTQLATPWVSSQRVSGAHSTAAHAETAGAPASITTGALGGGGGGVELAGVWLPEQATSTDARDNPWRTLRMGAIVATDANPTDADRAVASPSGSPLRPDASPLRRRW